MSWMWSISSIGSTGQTPHVGGGSGLGLATSAKLAEAMGMSLEAKVDRGRLTIELRTTKADEQCEL